MAVVQSINSSALERIEDRNVRDVLKQLVGGWQVRNGQSGSGENAFLTEADLKKAFQKQPIAAAVAEAISNAPRKVSSAYTPIGKLINDLQAEILADPFFQFLGERIKLIDTPTTGLIDQMIGLKDGLYQIDKTINDPVNGLYSELKGAGLRIGGATAGYANLTQLKADAVSASYQYTDQIRAQLNQNIESGNVTEKNVRVQSDNALSEAINTIWATVGDGTALVQTGSNTVSSRNGALASAWQQVQATLKDPQTGKILTSVAGRAEFNVANDKITGLSGQYTVKLDAGGYVAGYGLASGKDINGRPYSKMYFRANTFAIGSPNGTVNPITGEAVGAQIPFIVKTEPFFMNGRVYPAGVYIDKAFIIFAQADEFDFGVGTIGTANIKDLTVTTLKIGNNAVTVPAYVNGYGGSSHGAGGMSKVGQVSVSYPDNVSIVALASWQASCGGISTNSRFEIRVANVGTGFGQSDSLLANYTSSHAGSGRINLPAGNYVFEVWLGNDWYQGAYTLGQWSCTLLGVMR